MHAVIKGGFIQMPPQMSVLLPKSVIQLTNLEYEYSLFLSHIYIYRSHVSRRLWLDACTSKPCARNIVPHVCFMF